MEFTPGMIVVIVALAIFYLRIMQLRGQKKRLDKEKILAHMREANRKKGKVAPLPPKNPNTPPYQVRSWVLVIIGVVFMLAGVMAYSSDIFPQLMQDLWWAITTVGIVIFWFCFKVE